MQEENVHPGSRELGDKLREEIEQQAKIYHASQLSQFQKRVNESAVKIALDSPNLIRKGRRGELLQLARKKVANEGYSFKKGKSHSKVYGEAGAPSSTLKRPRLDESMRKDRMDELNENIDDVSGRIVFKEKRRSQAEAV